MMDKMEYTKETIFTFDAIIDYAPGAIVSKTIINKTTGTVTLFSFDAGQALSEHTAPFDALVQVVEGKALITINHIDHELKQGESIIMPAGAPHAVMAIEKFKMILTMIKS